MDALYARRKRERRRIEIEVLQEQCLEYNNKNSALGKQNKWLEGLLKNANAVVQLHAEGNVDSGNTSTSPNLRGLFMHNNNSSGQRGQSSSLHFG